MGFIVRHASLRFLSAGALAAALAACATTNTSTGAPPAATHALVRPAATASEGATPGATHALVGAAASQDTSPTASGGASPAATHALVQPAATATTSESTLVPGASNCPMFPADNIWNTDISKLPVESHSAAWLSSMDSSTAFLHLDYGFPYAIVTNAHPTVQIQFTYADQSDQIPYPLGPDTPIEGGENAPADTDRHALMVNETTCTLYELYQAQYSASGSTAGSGAVWDLRSNALRPAGWTSGDAAGLPMLPGLLDFAQIQQAVATGKPIMHAIRVYAQHTAAAYIWPATHDSGSGSIATVPPMGARFRLSASFNVDGFCNSLQPYCADAKAVLVEMQHYGLIVADNGTSWFFGGSENPAWPTDLISQLDQIPAASFEAVNTSCLMISSNSGEARAQPGCPIG